jgi:hypothetical protein
MNKFFTSVLIAAAVGFSTAAVQAMPLIPDQAPSGMITQVLQGCGPGGYRGPYGHCRYGGPVVVAPPVYYGGPAYYVAPPGAPVGPGPYPCGGRGQHRVCGPNGCWMACN